MTWHFADPGAWSHSLTSDLVRPGGTVCATTGDEPGQNRRTSAQRKKADHILGKPRKGRDRVMCYSPRRGRACFTGIPSLWAHAL